MTYKYINMRDFKVHKYYFVFLIISLMFALSPYMRKKAIVTSLFFLFAFIYSYALLFYYRKYSIKTDDKGFQINSFSKNKEYAWSDVISIKKAFLKSYKIETKKGSIRFDPKGLLPIELYTGQKECDGRNLEEVFIGEIAQKAKYVHIPNELINKI